MKTDQFRQGTHVYLGNTNHQVCPVTAQTQYLTRRGSKPGPLFILPSSKSLTRMMFSEALNKAFQDLHMDPCIFNTHSFRIGAATSAKQAGISDAHLKVLCRWRSDEYLKYVWVLSHNLANLSKTLTSATRNITCD